jgi:hypothetical protein
VQRLFDAGVRQAPDDVVDVGLAGNLCRASQHMGNFLAAKKHHRFQKLQKKCFFFWKARFVS